MCPNDLDMQGFFKNSLRCLNVFLPNESTLLRITRLFLLCNEIIAFVARRWISASDFFFYPYCRYLFLFLGCSSSVSNVCLGRPVNLKDTLWSRFEPGHR